MDPRITGPAAAQAPAGLGTGLSESLREQSGLLHGERVQVLPPGGSVLGDAAEEVAMLFAEKAESRRHEDRVVKATGRPSLASVEQINAYLEKAHKDSDTQALARMAQALLAAGGEHPYALARSHPRFQQATEQFLLFQYARQLAAEQGLGPEVLQRLDAAIADLETLYGDRIQANLLTIEPAAAYAQTAQDVGHFQGALQAVLGAPTLQLALQEVLQLAGQQGQRLDSALDHLMQGLGACLGTGLSAQEGLLAAVVTDLFHLKSMKTVLLACQVLVRAMARERQGEGDEAQGQPDEVSDEERESAGSARGRGARTGRRHARAG